MTKRKPSTSCNIERKRGLKERRDGQMAFSMVAIILLLISSVAVATISSHTNGPSNRGDSISESVEVEINEIQELVNSLAFSSAMNALNISANDDTKLQANFQRTIDEQLGRTFPLIDGNYEVTLRSENIMITEMPGAKVGIGNGDVGSNMLAFFRVVGKAEICILSSSVISVRNITVDAPIYCPLPMLREAWKCFEILISNSDSMLWQIVRYEITALVQLRTYQWSFSSLGSMIIDQLLSEEDIWNAIVLATILLQRSTFSQYDHGLLGSFKKAPGSSFDKSVLPDLITGEGPVDPADIFLRLYGNNEIDARILIAQSFFASTDLLALRILEYLDVVDIIGTIDRTIESGEFFLKDVVSFVLGKDMEAQNVKNWVKHKFEYAGIEETAYRYLWTEEDDWYVRLNSSTIALLNSSYCYQLVTLPDGVGVDLGVRDILASDEWKELMRNYILSTNELIDSITALVKEISTIIASTSSISSIRLQLDPYDEKGFFEEVEQAVITTLDSSDGYFSNSAEKLVIKDDRDPMGLSMISSIKDNKGVFFQRERTLQEAIDSLSEAIYNDVLSREASFANAPHDYNVGTIRGYIEQSKIQNIIPQIEAFFEKDVDERISVLEVGLIRPSPEAPSFWGNVVQVLLEGGSVDKLGMEKWVEDNVIEMIEDMVASNDLKGGKIIINLPPEYSMSASNLEGKYLTINLRIETDLDNGLFIDVKDPKENMDGRINPNSHITDLKEGSMSPFINCWSFSVEGLFKMRLSLVQGTSFIAQSYEGFTFFGANSDIIVSSGWPLPEVDYQPTNTLTGDMLDLFDQIYKAFKDRLRTIGGAIYDVYQLVQSMRSRSLELISSSLQVASDAVKYTLETLQSSLRNMISEGICSIIESLTYGRRLDPIEIMVLGVTLSVELNPKDNCLAGSRTIVKVTFGYFAGDSKISASSRLFKDPSGNYNFLLNASIISENVRLSMVIDPFLASFPHILEVRGWVQGLYVDLCMPEIVRCKQIGFSLADIPGIGEMLSNIPLPIPGAKGQVNAGISIKLATASQSGPVINEFELNPKGKDGGKEWVEIFNPSKQVVSLSGWTIETMHGKKIVDELGDVLLLPYSRMVYEFQAQALDNGGTGLLPDGDSLVLRDASGKRVDTAPFVPDTKNDGRTWQRDHDGSENWVFREGTKGSPNSESVSRWLDPGDAMLTLEGIVRESLDILEASGGSLFSLGKAMEISMRNALTTIIEDLSGAIIEVGLFLELSLVDETGSVGFTTRYSVCVDSSILEEAWSIVCRTMRDMTTEPSSSMRSLSTFASEDLLAENIWFGLSAGVKMKSLKLQGSKQALACKATTVVKVNLAATGVFLGEEIGAPKMIFGILVSGVLSDNVPLLGMQVSEALDLWLIKGSLVAPE
ncbi:MAG: lamin tail domain-containing protein [Methanomassiliicoccales archaeon]|nr:MAG: lamin tail domain-containing protein [Methanomassiliicoccales archaeon]